MTLPPYNPDAKCPKCGGGEVDAMWCPADATSNVSRRDAPDKDHLNVYAEHMDRTCTRCGYAWPEAPMDQEAG